jgi:DNA-binding transcriptional LysR family regulator
MALPARNCGDLGAYSETADGQRGRRCARAVIAGQGFAISPRWMFAPELESGEVVSVLDDWTLPPIDLWVIIPSGRLTSTKARTFVKWFEKMMSGSALSNRLLEAVAGR